MGKAKKRTLNRTADKSVPALKRDEAVNKIIENIRTGRIDGETVRLICLFGIAPDELAEAGAAYEEISAVKHLML